MTVPCKGWQKNCSASRVVKTIFHLQKGSHFAVKIPSVPKVDFPRGGQRQGKCEFPTSLSEVQECSSFFLFVWVLSFFLAGNWYNNKNSAWSWTWPIWNNWKRIHRINLVNEVVIWNYFIYWYLFETVSNHQLVNYPFQSLPYMSVWRLVVTGSLF